MLLRAVSKVSNQSFSVSRKSNNSKGFSTATSKPANKTGASASNTAKTKAQETPLTKDQIVKTIIDLVGKYQTGQKLKENASAGKIKVVNAATRVKTGFKPSNERTKEEDMDVVRDKLPFDEVATRYAYLLYAQYKSDNNLEAIDADIEKLINGIQKTPVLANIVFEEFLTKNQRHTKLEEILKKQSFGDTIDAFLRVLVDNGRLVELPNIIEAFGQIRMKIEDDFHFAQVISAAPLKDNERAEIKNLLSNQFNPQGELVLEESVDESLKGGYELFYEDKYHLDNTQKTRIDEISKTLKQTIKSHLTKTEAASDLAFKEYLKDRN